MHTLKCKKVTDCTSALLKVECQYANAQDLTLGTAMHAGALARSYTLYPSPPGPSARQRKIDGRDLTAMRGTSDARAAAPPRKKTGASRLSLFKKRKGRPRLAEAGGSFRNSEGREVFDGSVERKQSSSRSEILGDDRGEGAAEAVNWNGRSETKLSTPASRTMSSLPSSIGASASTTAASAASTAVAALPHEQLAFAGRNVTKNVHAHGRKRLGMFSKRGSKHSKESEKGADLPGSTSSRRDQEEGEGGEGGEEEEEEEEEEDLPPLPPLPPSGRSSFASQPGITMTDSGEVEEEEEEEEERERGDENQCKEEEAAGQGATPFRPPSKTITEIQAQKLTEIFDSVDQDSSGELDFKSFAKLFRKLWDAHTPEEADAKTLTDSPGDGSMSRISDSMIRKLFKKVDEDRNGHVSMAEFMAWWPYPLRLTSVG